MPASSTLWRSLMQRPRLWPLFFSARFALRASSAAFSCCRRSDLHRPRDEGAVRFLPVGHKLFLFDDILHRRRRASFGDGGLIGNLKDPRFVFACDGECLRSTINSRDHSVKWNNTSRWCSRVKRMEKQMPSEWRWRWLQANRSRPGKGRLLSAASALDVETVGISIQEMPEANQVSIHRVGVLCAGLLG